MMLREGWAKPSDRPKPLYDEDDGFPTTAPVGSFPQGESSVGLEDMAGNVSEWTSDVYAAYPGGTATGADGTKRVTRGGAWFFTEAKDFRTTRRIAAIPSARDIVLGFRCARDGEAGKK